MMPEPVFDHEKLDVYRLSIEYVTESYRTAQLLSGTQRHIRDQWLRAAQSKAAGEPLEWTEVVASLTPS